MPTCILPSSFISRAIFVDNLTLSASFTINNSSAIDRTVTKRYFQIISFN